MPSKYAFISRAETEQEQQVDLAAYAQQADAAAAARQQAEAEEQKRREAALLSTLYAGFCAHSAVIVDILTDYLHTEYGPPISIESYGARPNLYSWFATRDAELVLTLFMLVQGDPPEAGLFVDGEERPNFSQLLIVLRTHTGLLASRSMRAAELRARLEQAEKDSKILRYKLR